MKKTILFSAVFLVLFCVWPPSALAYQPELIYFQTGDIQIENPEISQAFYDELKGEPRYYFIDSDKSFELYLNILVPEAANRNGRYSANIFLGEQKIAFLDSSLSDWQEFYEPFGRDYYLRGPELDNLVSVGRYKIEIFSPDNQGKYVLAVGKKEIYDASLFSSFESIKSFVKNYGVSILNIYWQLPLLKMTFFKTDVLQFFLTPFGIAGIAVVGAILIFLAIIYYLIGVIKGAIKHRQAKTLLLTSNGMQMKAEIMKLLQKPAYDITVAFISTAAKPEENLDYLKKDWTIMRDEMGFNVEEIDIEGKTEAQVMKMLELKDIIFVEGGNTFYLLKAMRRCKFGRIIRKLLKNGKVYIGVSAGSIVAGRNIKTAGWLGEEYGNKEKFGVKNLKGLNLIPFDIFVHYQPEHAEIIRKKLPWRWQRRRLKIITDEQAVLVQGKEVMLIGKGDAIVV